jgi:N,N-dimethylformamidase
VTSIHAYSDRLSLAPGELVRFMVSAEDADTFRADIVRLIHGDTNPAGPGYKEELVETPANGMYTARQQPIHAGSHVVVSDPRGRLGLLESFSLHAFIWPTTPARGSQGLLTRWTATEQTGYALVIENGELALWLGDGHVYRLNSGQPLRTHMWYSVAATYDAGGGNASVHQAPLVTSTNSLLGPAAQFEGPAYREGGIPVGALTTSAGPFILAGFATAGGVAGHYNGKIDRPSVWDRALSRAEVEALSADGEPITHGLVASWDFADGIGPDGISTDRVADVVGGLHGICSQMPARGVTGHNWSGLEDNFTHRPHEYGAIHFHEDDIEDAGWAPDFELRTLPGLRSGVYAARLRAGQAEEYVPFFIRPPTGTTTADILFLAPTASYMAYANYHTAFDGEALQPVIGRTPIVGEQDLFLYEHSELGLSMYDVHVDGSGVCYASRLRPLIDMRPKYRQAGGNLWQFPADLYLVDWLEALGHRYDVATDEDLHRFGADLLLPYRVVLTGTHPEYTSAAMLDALETYVRTGGRLMYLGGNGFYWVTSFHPAKPHLIEVRRGESGSRAWQARPGEYFHSTSGERGGLWRNRARAPQKLVGVGFGAEGFDHSSYYRRLPDSFDSRVRFIFEGIGDEELIGNFGLVGGGAAGYELDRYDLQLGTPPNALLLASSEGHSDNYPHVVEEIFFMFPGQGGTQDPAVRADLVYFTTPNDGAVFSTGSISWCGSLSHNGYANNVSRVTDNVLRRFVKNEPLPGAR